MVLFVYMCYVPYRGLHNLATLTSRYSSGCLRATGDKIMFTLNDIRNIAIQIERNGAETYRKASGEIADPELSNMAARMADDELRHLKWFEQLDTGAKTPADHPEIESMGRDLLQEMMAHRTFSLAGAPLRAAEDIDALLIQSLAFEEDTVLFYETLGAFIEEPETLRQLDVIISEERRHIAQIEQMRAKYRDRTGKTDTVEKIR